MSSDKRARQRANRDQKRAVEAKAASRKNLLLRARKVLFYVVGGLLLLFVVTQLVG